MASIENKMLDVRNKAVYEIFSISIFLEDSSVEFKCTTLSDLYPYLSKSRSLNELLLGSTSRSSLLTQREGAQV